MNTCITVFATVLTLSGSSMPLLRQSRATISAHCCHVCEQMLYNHYQKTQYTCLETHWEWETLSETEQVSDTHPSEKNTRETIFKLFSKASGLVFIAETKRTGYRAETNIIECECKFVKNIFEMEATVNINALETSSYESILQGIAEYLSGFVRGNVLMFSSTSQQSCTKIYKTLAE